jgi:hypothetical protein
MCTLSFVTKTHGFLLGMNRDEQRSRAIASPPSVHRCGDLPTLYPSEQGGGTWIGINGAGLSAALINWYSRPQYGGTPASSRGAIIPRLLASRSFEGMERSLLSLPLSRLNPFRLFMIGSDDKVVREYRSDGSGAVRVDHPWETAHWFSSGHNEASATMTRGTVCGKAGKETDAGTLPWLERLHSSHDPEAGSDSICMHRDDAVTVSLTLLDITGNAASMSYRNGAPCQSQAGQGHNSRLTIDRIL